MCKGTFVKKNEEVIKRERRKPSNRIKKKKKRTNTSETLQKSPAFKQEKNVPTYR